MLSHEIVVVGGGAAGIAVTASLLRRQYLPPTIYWDGMLKGHERLATPRPLPDAER